jgi:regulator of cell morphogenesis and NO signaling
MMTVQPTTTLADLATTYPAASRVFHRLGLDYCCGGRRPLEEACRERGLVPGDVLSEITAERPAADAATPWSERPLDELIAFIVGRYHQGLRRELPELVALADKVERRHADKATRPTGLAEHLRQVHAAVLEHLEKEERILFPMIQAGRGASAAGPVQVMEQEHCDHAANLARTRELAHDLVAPEEACTSWRALYLRLHELEGDLMEHIHLENNVLFPRALRG